MSESSIKIEAYFDEPRTAEKVEQMLKDAMTAIRESEKEMFLHNYLEQIGQTHGIKFDSWWVPTNVFIREWYWLNLELVGSPSGTEEQDIITWLKQLAVATWTGEMTLDGGGDVEVVDISYVPRPKQQGDLDLEYRDGVDNTLLHLAAEAGDAKKVKALIDAGADLEATNKAEITPLFMAINSDLTEKKALACVELLIDAGASVNVTAHWGDSALQHAKANKFKKIAAALEAAGAN